MLLKKHGRVKEWKCGGKKKPEVNIRREEKEDISGFYRKKERGNK